LTARATDNLGVSATSAVVSIYVDKPPVVTMTGPADNSAYPFLSTIVITGYATDADGQLAKMELLSSGVSQGSCAPAPSYSSYTCKWTWNGAADGRYTFTWRATDDHGAT